MRNPLEINSAFVQRMRSGTDVVGSFVKMPHHSVVEVMAGAGFDFLTLDAEHGYFDRASIDSCVLAGLAWECPVFVRIPVAEPDWIMYALDSGAAGIFVPHVATRADAERLAQLVSFAPTGKRGFSPSVRAGSYGLRGMAAHRHGARQDFALVCQIEDPAGVDAAAEIAAVDGVDALFIGPADLAVAAGYDDMGHPEALALCERGLAAAKDRVPGAIFVSDLAATERWRAAGASVFMVGSDQTMLVAGSASKGVTRDAAKARAGSGS